MVVAAEKEFLRTVYGTDFPFSTANFHAPTIVASGRGGAVTVTVAAPEMLPLAALTEPANVPSVEPAVNTPAVASTLPPPFTTGP